MTSSQASASERWPSSFDLLTEPVRRWVWQQGWDELREIQERAIPVILDGKADLIIAAPTAGGKTEAAFLPLLSRIAGGSGRGFRALYLSPLKALINDQFRRLDGLCEAAGVPVHRWHGDVASTAKARARRDPDGIVLMTPESLEALCVRRGIEIPGLFAPLEAIVVDELHAFIGSERGIQLQSLLRRLETAVGRPVVRIGLSATLGDMAIAAEFLRPRRASEVVILEDHSVEQAVLLQLRGYTRNQEREAGMEPQIPSSNHAIARDILEHLRGTHNLVFAGSRSEVELYSDLLRQVSERTGITNEFYPHHANLSRAHREFVEERLREGIVPTSALCTSTLELGVDIGAVESVAQIGARHSVTSLRQRLGRSGRRGNKPAILRVYICERAWGSGLHPSDALRFELIQSIAMVRLLLAGWCETPRPGALHLSTLVHQILALVAQWGMTAASNAYDVLCRNGPFRSISPSQFAQILRAIGNRETALIEQAADGSLLLGEVGERLVQSHHFYAVFQTSEEYSLVHQGKELGTIPIVTTLVPEMTLVFSGRRWRVIEVQDREKRAVVVPAGAGVPPLFGGEGAAIDDEVAGEMRRLYAGEDIPAFLDVTARTLLGEARRSYHELGLDNARMVPWEAHTLIFPWAGTAASYTLVLALKKAGLAASLRGLFIEVDHAPAWKVSATLEHLARTPISDSIQLVDQIAKLERNKFDHFLPRTLLALDFAAEHLSPAAVPSLAEEIVKRRPVDW